MPENGPPHGRVAPAAGPRQLAAGLACKTTGKEEKQEEGLGSRARPGGQQEAPECPGQARHPCLVGLLLQVGARSLGLPWETGEAQRVFLGAALMESLTPGGWSDIRSQFWTDHGGHRAALHPEAQGTVCSS